MKTSKTMKDSGIPWIGDIPQDWSSTPLFSIFCEHKNKNKKGTENNVLSLSYGKIIKRNVDTNKGLLPESFNTYNIVDIGDIVLRLTDLQNDKTSLRTSLVTQKGIITSAYLSLRAKSKQCSRYYHYLLHTYDTIKVLYNMGDGVRQNLKYSELSKMPLLICELPTQQAIANYLDDKCSKIDSTIEREKHHIEKLKEYRKSVITEAVTKGLDPTAPMKDSGIEWIGDIPQAWETKKLKSLCKLKTGSTPPANIGINLDGEGYKWFTPSDFSSSLILKNSNKYISSTTVEQLGIDIYPSGSILLIGIGGTIGKVGITLDTAYSNQQITAIIPIKIVNKYLLYYFVSIMNYIKDNALYTTLPIINNNYLYSIHITHPPLPAQQAIADYLDTKTAQVDSAILKKETLIKKLQEYKKSVIFEAVTGKMEV